MYIYIYKYSTYPNIFDIPNIDDDNNILLDVDGNARPSSRSAKTVGCSQSGSSTTVGLKYLIMKRGPSYLTNSLDPTVTTSTTTTAPTTTTKPGFISQHLNIYFQLVM